MTVDRRQWQRPELTVLVRSRPEEAVLTGCKSGTSSRATTTEYCVQSALANKPLSRSWPALGAHQTQVPCDARRLLQ